MTSVPPTPRSSARRSSAARTCRSLALISAICRSSKVWVVGAIVCAGILPPAAWSCLVMGMLSGTRLSHSTLRPERTADNHGTGRRGDRALDSYRSATDNEWHRSIRGVNPLKHHSPEGSPELEPDQFEVPEGRGSDDDALDVLRGRGCARSDAAGRAHQEDGRQQEHHRCATFGIFMSVLLASWTSRSLGDWCLERRGHWRSMGPGRAV